MIDVQYSLLGLVAVLVGFMDGAIGGGGLLSVPVIQWLYPHFSWEQIFSINKSICAWGMGVAFWQYGRQTPSKIMWKRLVWTFPLALIASVLGASLIQFVDKVIMRWLVIVLLTLVATYVFSRPKIGSHIADEEHIQATSAWKWVAVAACVAAYDGFFGPGSGAFFLFSSVVILNLSFLQAQTTAKGWNFASNLGALFYFMTKGQFSWSFMPLGIFYMVGSWLGSRVVLKYGNALIRQLFLYMVVLSIGRLLYQALF